MSSEAPECPICLDVGCDYKTACGHEFHAHCLHEWAQKDKRLLSCPVCYHENVLRKDFGPRVVVFPKDICCRNNYIRGERS